MDGVNGRMAQQAPGCDIFLGSFCFMDKCCPFIFSGLDSTLDYLLK